MNKQLLLALSLAAGTAANAQTTITAADQPITLQVYQQGRDTTLTQNPGNSGTAQTYNFSALLNQEQDSTTITLPQWTPYGSSFPMSNMAAITNVNEAYIYGSFTSTVFELNGQASDPFGSGVIPLVFSNPETQMIYPAAYGSSFADTAGGVNLFYLGIDPGIGFTIDSVRVRSLIIKDSDYDAWGTATTPMGTANVLRQNTYRLQIDTIDIYAFGNWAYDFIVNRDSMRVYSYWANGYGLPIVELEDQYDLGSISNCRWLIANPALTSVGTAPAAQNINTYPNPANDVVTFNTEATEGTIEIFDMTGRVVKTAIIETNNTQIDVSDLAEGVYTYRVNTNTVSTGKIVVAH